MNKKISCTFYIFLFLTAISQAQHDFSISPLFSNNMILQSGKEFQINGQGIEGDRINIEITINTQTIKKEAIVDNQGKWSATFSPLPPNINCSFSFSNKTTNKKIESIKTGDVWLIIGGSNTVHKLGNNDFFEKEKTIHQPGKFNYLTIPKDSHLKPQTLIRNTLWKKDSFDNLSQIPSIAYYFGTTLNQNINTPLGLINCGFGGSLIETWLNPIDLGFSSESVTKQNIEHKKQHQTATINSFKKKISYEVKIDTFNEDRSLFSSTNFDDSQWHKTLVPETFEQKGLNNFDGVAWFRKSFHIPNGIQFDKINFGFVDDSDEVYINGKFIGGIKNGYGVPRIYDIPKNLLIPGRNVIAVRVHDFGGGGGIYGAKELYYLSGNDFTYNIAGDWKFKIETLESDVKMNDIRRPSMVYNQMIHPLTTFPIKGIIWYQGEVEATTLSHFDDYSNKLKKIIKGYRREFSNPKLPFVIIQLPSYGEKNTVLHSWVNFKYTQEKIANELAHTEIISITDLINTEHKTNIHLSNHKATGIRAAKTVLTTYYNHKNGSKCPSILSYHIHKKSILLNFKNAQKWSVTDNYGYVKGFEVAGSNKKFTKTQAKIINNNSIVIETEKPFSLKYLQYCGNANSIIGNLFNEKGMPLLPFCMELSKK